MNWPTVGPGAAVVGVLLCSSPASSTVVPPSASWHNPGDLYADSVLYTSYTTSVGLSSTTAWSDVTDYLQTHDPAGIGEGSATEMRDGAFWGIPGVTDAGEAYVLLEPAEAGGPENMAPRRVHISPEELGPQDFEVLATLYLGGGDESAAIICCAALQDDVSRLQRSLPDDLRQALIPPGDHPDCLTAWDASLHLSLHLDQTSRSGIASPYQYETVLPELDGGETHIRPSTPLPHHGSYSISMSAAWLSHPPEACVEVARSDWRDGTRQEFSVCPSQFADEFPSLSDPDAVVPPLEMPSPTECQLAESWTLDDDGERQAITEEEWCSLYRSRCEVHENALGAGRYVHSAEMEEACEPCDAYYQVTWDDLEASADDEGNETNGCAVSTPVTSRTSSNGPLWLFLVAIAAVVRRMRGSWSHAPSP